MSSFPINATVLRFEKRRQPSKHYVFVLMVTNDDNTTSVLYRRYSNFFNFHCSLLEQFPQEAGASNDSASSRIIPFLPGKILFGRSQIREVAIMRQARLKAYCQRIFRLPSSISRHSLVTEFFSPWPSDSNASAGDRNSSSGSSNSISGSEQKSPEFNVSEPESVQEYQVIADYRGQKKTEATVKHGQTVQVLDKKETGWWFVMNEDTEGWLPACHLNLNNEPEIPVKNESGSGGELYIALQNYKAEEADELSLTINLKVVVKKKDHSGWWLVTVANRTGYVPFQVLARQNDTTTAFNTSRMEGHSSIPPRPNSIKRQEVTKCKPPPLPPKKMYAFEDFYATIDDCLHLTKGECVTIIEKSNQNWTYVFNSKGQQGWVPSTYLVKEQPLDGC